MEELWPRTTPLSTAEYGARAVGMVEQSAWFDAFVESAARSVRRAVLRKILIS